MTTSPMSLSIDLDGHRYHGFYAMQSTMLTVWSPALGSRTIQLHGRTPLPLAQELLAEVVRECGPSRGIDVVGSGWLAGEARPGSPARHLEGAGA